MKNTIKKIIKALKYSLWYSPFQKSFLDSKTKQEGEIILFGNKFYYHNGLAFYETYKEIFERNIYEFNSNSSNPIIIDCGANMGLSVLYFSKKYPNAEIIAFEPDESVLPFLEKNIYSQKIDNLKLYKKAVWTEETELKFYTDNGLGGRIGKEYKNQNPIIIKALRLRDFLETRNSIDMLKIDIEGSEYAVIQDCEDVLSHVNNVFIEYHSICDEEQHLEDVLNILKRQGFRYHLKESFSRAKPFVDNRIACQRFDMAINIFAYRSI
jgi:FkbM family methyltransferase